MDLRCALSRSESKPASLSRGWRTPDPPSTRDAVSLPGCDLKLSFEEHDFDDGASDDTSSDHPSAHVSGRAAPRGRGWQQNTIDDVLDWPSRSPSPTVSRYATEMPQATDSTPAPTIACHPDESGRTTQVQPNIVLVCATAEEHAMFSHSCFVCGPNVVMAVPQPPLPPFPKNFAEATSWGSQHEAVPSLGSSGHPLNCAGACKFYKRTRGCKDGSQCNRCHLCEWKKCEWKTRATKRVIAR